MLPCPATSPFFVDRNSARQGANWLALGQISTHVDELVPATMSLARLAQRAERQARNLAVVGSSPKVGVWTAHARA